MKRKKELLYIKQKGQCNVVDCNIINIDELTIDHIVRQSYARSELRWSKYRINHINNLQLLCKKHHDFKDALTPVALKKLQKKWERKDIPR